MRARDLVCLSHVPWAHALERPHQVMRRLARDRRVFYVEEPVVVTEGAPSAELRTEDGVQVLSIRAPADTSPTSAARARRRAVAKIARVLGVRDPILWVYQPTSVGAARDLQPSVLVYDCIDEHAARRSAPLDARAREAELFARADLVFVASDALFEAKRGRNVSTYPVPSSTDAAHFARGRRERDVLGGIPRPRVGFLGAVDDRVDLARVDELAERRPDVSVVLAGPITDVSPEELPRRPNLHWLGARAYDELPAIVGSWDVAFVPWRIEDATLRVEPAGVLACIAAGTPVVSTPLPAVVERYAGHGVVTIADPSWLSDAVERALEAPRFDDDAARALLARTSWDRSVNVMSRLLAEATMNRALTLTDGR